ncbi:MAG TPA: DUF1697 domain-containing protein [Candidatus Limnocylindrales bacterium]
MTTYVALLRGINVGGHRRLPMDVLRGLVESLGHGDVVTYIQSGNVVFDSPGADGRALADVLELRILDEVGFAVDVVVRSAGEIAAIAAANPFLARAPDPKALHVAFARDPIKGSDDSIDARFAPDEFCVAPGVIYLHTPAGFGTTRLTDAFLKRVAGSIVTTRNWNTVNKLAELADRGR